MAAYGEIHIVTTKDEDLKADRLIRRRASAGELRQLYERIYTTNFHDPAEAIMQRNIWQIVAHLFPNTVISGRSATNLRPFTPEGGNPKSYVFLTGPYARRTVQIPGVEIRVAEGEGALPGDVPFITDAFHISSQERQLLDNLRLSRTRDGVSRTLSREEVERVLVQILDSGGEENFNAIRERARAISGT